MDVFITMNFIISVVSIQICKALDCSKCPNLEAVLLRRDGFQVNCIHSPKVVLFEFVDSAKCEIEGVRYLPKALPEELKVELTPPLPDSASFDHLNSDLEAFIEGLKESDLPTLKKESPGQQDLASYKQKLTEWKNLLFGRVKGGLGYLGTPPSGSKELKEFYEKIKYYLSHLDAFLSKEENCDAFIERLQILQTQSACGARFIAELEQLFTMNCIGGETADLSKQFAQIASTEAKLAIERMFPDGNVHEINQAMFQLKDYLTGSYFKDQLSHEMDQAKLIIKFLKYHTSVNLVTTIQNGLKPNSPLEELFTQYLKENFSPELTKDILEELNQDVNELWEVTKERKIAAFGAYDLVRQKPAQERTAQEKLQMVALPQDEKACQNKEELEGLLKSKEKSFKDKNIQSGVESKKDEILYQEHYDQGANRWKPEIIAKALQKMGILATEAELFPKAN